MMQWHFKPPMRGWYNFSCSLFVKEGDSIYLSKSQIRRTRTEKELPRWWEFWKKPKITEYCDYEPIEIEEKEIKDVVCSRG